MSERQRDRFDRFIDRIMANGWGYADTDNLSAWWDVEGGGEIHVFLLLDGSFHIYGPNYQFAEVKKIKDAVRVADSFRDGKKVRPYDKHLGWSQ